MSPRNATIQVNSVSYQASLGNDRAHVPDRKMNRDAAIDPRLCARSLEVYMNTQTHPLEAYFHEIVQSTYASKLGLSDPEITGYVARMLCEFAEPDNIFRLRDESGKLIENLNEMVRASDPVYGTAPSFDAERAARKYIGDYALFVAGLCHDVVKAGASAENAGATLAELMKVGKESYFIVSQFNVFEYEKEAPLFTRLSDDFERCILGLALVREELRERMAQAPQEK
jgi:hypothetical protein